jgi:hypothetical protein
MMALRRIKLALHSDHALEATRVSIGQATYTTSLLAVAAQLRN